MEECEALYQELNSIFVKLPNVYPEWETNFPDLINQFEEADIQRNELWYRFYTNSNPVVDKSLNSKEKAGDTKYVDKRIYETRKEIVPLKGNAVCFDEDMQ